MGRAIHYRERLSCVLHVRPINKPARNFTRKTSRTRSSSVFIDTSLAHQLAQRQDEIFGRVKFVLTFNRSIDCRTASFISPARRAVVEILDAPLSDTT
jgi:hypothetical protein